MKIIKNEKFVIYLSHIVLLAIFLITIYSARAYFVLSKKANNSYFTELVNEVEQQIIKRYSFYEFALQGGLGLFIASEEVNLEEWRLYVETVYDKNYLPGINGLGFIKHIYEEDLEDFLEKTSKEYKKPFKNKPDTNFKDKFIIKYIVPEYINAKAIGLDVGFEKNRRQAAERALKTGLPSLTKRIQLVQDNQTRAGFLLFLPFTHPKTNNFLGWIYAPFIGDNFFSDLNTGRFKEVSYNVYDGENIDEEQFIYQGINDTDREKLFEVRTLSVAGQKWTVKYVPSKHFKNKSNSKVSFIIVVVGIIFDIFIYLLISNLIKQKRLISKEVAVKTRFLEDRNKTLEEFSSIAAHDLKEPIRNIASIVDLMKIDFADKLSKEMVGELNRIFNQSVRMNNLISELLDYALSGSEKNHLEKINLKLLIKEQLAFYKNENLKVKIDENIPDIISSKDKISMIFRNLISNAIKYNDNHIIEIEFGSLPSETKGKTILFVKDNGIGIAPEHQKSIFRIFKRLHKKNSYGGGTGIGLSIIYQAIKSLDEDIWLTSQEREGTIFFFTSRVSI